MLSPCLLFSSQPRSFLSPPEKGNHSLGSSTMERALVFAFRSQQLRAAGGETSGHRVFWLTKRCPVKAAARGWSSAPRSRAGQGPKQTPATAPTRVWGLEDERRGLILPSCEAGPCRLRAPTAGLSTTSQGRVKGGSRLIVLAIFQIHRQPNQLEDHSPEASTKTSKNLNPDPFPNTENGWRKEHLHQSLAQQVSRRHSLHGKKGECGFRPVVNPRPGTHPGNEAAPASSTPMNMPLRPSAPQPATSLPRGATTVTSSKHC